MAGYVNPEDIKQDQNNPFNRAMGLAVAIANNKNIALDMERFDDPMYEPSQTLFYIGGKSGATGMKSPEAFEDIEAGSNADMGDAIITYSGDKFNPSALVMRTSWVTRHYNGRWESAVADFTKVDSNGKIDSELWDWVDQGFGIEPQEDAEFICEVQSLVGAGITNEVSDFTVLAGEYIASINADTLVVDYGLCRGPVTSSLFTTEGFGFTIACDIIEIELSCDYDTLYEAAVGVFECWTAKATWNIALDIRTHKLFSGIDLEGHDGRKAMFKVVDHIDVNILSEQLHPYEDRGYAIWEIGIYPFVDEQPLVGMGGLFNATNAPVPPPEDYACFAGIIPFGYHPDGEYSGPGTQVFPILVGELPVEQFGYYSDINCRVGKWFSESDCTGHMYVKTKLIPPIFILTTDIIESDDDKDVPLASFTTAQRYLP